MPVSGLSR
jgi:hypothetical protein